MKVKKCSKCGKLIDFVQAAARTGDEWVCADCFGWKSGEGRFTEGTRVPLINKEQRDMILIAIILWIAYTLMICTGLGIFS